MSKQLAKDPSRGIGPAQLAGLTVQLALICLVVKLYEVESAQGLTRLLPLMGGGFVVNAMLPLRWRMSFFLALSVASIFLVLGIANGIWLIGIGLVLIGACHLPIPLSARVALILLLGAGLAYLQSGQLQTGWSPAVLPILGGMFMFRLAVYLYDLNNEKGPVSIQARLAYFFMLPNACFPFFPVVDYRAFLRSHYEKDALETYQIGMKWFFRGVVQLLVYRWIYHTFTDGPGDVETLGGVIAYMLSTYGLYLRVSGLFHLIVGVLCLYGFALPETHHLYFLASSFNDFWRRINIYWKDFMMKLFYYPVFMRVRHLGTIPAMCIATVVVFIGTWILHAYQWFWLRGEFPITIVDSLFWGFLGVMVIINSIYQAKHPKKATLGKPKWSWRNAALHSLKVVVFFTFMTMLWAFWSGSSVSEYRSLLQVAAGGSAGEFALLIAVLVGAVASGAAVQYMNFRGYSVLDEKNRPVLLRASALTAAGAVALAAVTIPELEEMLGTRAGRVAMVMRDVGLNTRDERILERGYYEGLLGAGKMGSRVWETRLQRPPADWIPFGQSDAVQLQDGVTWFTLKPSHETKHAYVTIRTNQWGMRDQEYTKEKPADTYRIAILGASYEMGFAVEQDAIYENVAEQMINAKLAAHGAGKVEILNFGVPGYGLIEWVEACEGKVWDFGTDAVLVTARAGDVYRTTGFLTKAVQNGVKLSPPLADIVGRAGLDASMSEAEIQRRLNRRRAMGESFALQLYQWGYAEIAKRCREHGAKAIWVWIPRAEEGDATSEKVLQMRLAEDVEMPTLDLDGAYEGLDLKSIHVAPWDFHPNEEGHLRLGTRLGKEILAHPEIFGLKVGDAGTAPTAPAP